jgi:hypothetical protein
LDCGTHAQGTATSGLIFTSQFMCIMAEIPETAPKDETHFLQETAYVHDVRYGPGKTSLRTWGAGDARLSLKRQPTEVSDEGGPILQLRELKKYASGWTYDPLHRLLQMRHRGKQIVIKEQGFNDDQHADSETKGSW